MKATVFTSDGPQLVMDASEAILLLMTLPVGDYHLEFHPQMPGEGSR